MYCDQCGTRLNDGDRFCQACGAALPEPLGQAVPESASTVEPSLPSVTAAPPAVSAAGPKRRRTGLIAAVLGVLVIGGAIAAVAASGGSDSKVEAAGKSTTTSTEAEASTTVTGSGATVTTATPGSQPSSAPPATNSPTTRPTPNTPTTKATPTTKPPAAIPATTTPTAPSTTATTGCPTGKPTVELLEFKADYVPPGEVPYAYWRVTSKFKTTNTTSGKVRVEERQVYVDLENGKQATGSVSYQDPQDLLPGKSVEWSDQSNWNDEGKPVSSHVVVVRYYFSDAPRSCPQPNGS